MPRQAPPPGPRGHQEREEERQVGQVLSVLSKAPEPKKDVSAFCPQCGLELVGNHCKLTCPRCRYYMSCSDYY